MYSIEGTVFRSVPWVHMYRMELFLPMNYSSKNKIHRLHRCFENITVQNVSHEYQPIDRELEKSLTNGIMRVFRIERRRNIRSDVGFYYVELVINQILNLSSVFEVLQIGDTPHRFLNHMNPK